MATSESSGDRRIRLVDEALRLVAEGGLAAVTHRSVEAAAGVPHGTVTYWFGNRDGLVAAMVDRCVAVNEAQVSGIAAGIAASLSEDRALDVDAIAQAVAEWIEDSADMHVARFELELAAVREPRLRERMREAAEVFWRTCAPLARAAGSDDPERDGRAMASMVDGLLIDRLAHPPQGDEVLVTAIRQLLRSWLPDGA